MAISAAEGAAADDDGGLGCVVAGGEAGAVVGASLVAGARVSAAGLDIDGAGVGDAVEDGAETGSAGAAEAGTVPIETATQTASSPAHVIRVTQSATARAE